MLKSGFSGVAEGAGLFRSAPLRKGAQRGSNEEGINNRMIMWYAFSKSKKEKVCANVQNVEQLKL
jgi:hypothetical protein